MKKIKLIITFFCLILFTNVHIFAQNKTPEPQRTKIVKHNLGKFYPRMPSNQYLEFIYFNNSRECLFTFNYDIEVLSVTITEITTHYTYTGEVSQDNPVMYQFLPSGNYIITCTSDNGDIFYGECEII